MKWMVLPFRRYFEFGGRSRRLEYWMFVLLCFAVNLVSGTIVGSFMSVANASSSTALTGAAGALTMANGVFTLAIVIPSIAVGVRRLHDTNRTGWWLLLPGVPYLVGIFMLLGGVAAMFDAGVRGSSSSDATVAAMVIGIGLLCAGFAVSIVLLVFLFLPGTAGPNRFGPDPKGEREELARVFQ